MASPPQLLLISHNGSVTGQKGPHSRHCAGAMLALISCVLNKKGKSAADPAAMPALLRLKVKVLTRRAGQKGGVVLDGDDCVVVAIPIPVPCAIQLHSGFL